MLALIAWLVVTALPAQGYQLRRISQPLGKSARLKTLAMDVHLVAADDTTEWVFLPIAANDMQAQCHAGCIAVFAARR